MNDLISRQAAYEVLTACYHHKTDAQHNALREALNKVPSADIDLSDFSDKLWHIAYERGKAEAVPSAQPDVPDANVGDMISRQAAIDEAYAVIVDDAVYDVVQVETLEGLPTVDAVKVVRCADCYHYDEKSEKCILNNSEFKPTDYCSYGSK